MEQNSLATIIRELTNRALWEVKNVIDCVPDELWEKQYCAMPCWKHIYHMLHSLDLWLINPRDPFFVEPALHEAGLNDLDAVSSKSVSRTEIEAYYGNIKKKIKDYLAQPHGNADGISDCG